MASGVGNAEVGDLRLCHCFGNNNNNNINNNNKTRLGSRWLSLAAWHLQPRFKGSCKVSRAPMAVSPLWGQQENSGFIHLGTGEDTQGLVATHLARWWIPGRTPLTIMENMYNT